MPLIKEDGTGLPNANTYANVADSDAYHADHLYPSTWTSASTTNKEKALALATRFIDQSYQFNGLKLKTTQSLQWPRVRAHNPDTGLDFPSNALPADLVRACCEMERSHSPRQITGTIGPWSHPNEHPWNRPFHLRQTRQNQTHDRTSPTLPQKVGTIPRTHQRLRPNPKSMNLDREFNATISILSGTGRFPQKPHLRPSANTHPRLKRLSRQPRPDRRCLAHVGTTRVAGVGRPARETAEFTIRASELTAILTVGNPRQGDFLIDPTGKTFLVFAARPILGGPRVANLHRRNHRRRLRRHRPGTHRLHRSG